ncbi:hypothetical protein [Actinacidiphila sp. ITFR-21]|uniref:hypothetical protein n=1 Tax=Actinacidiphila sp. ITFR-21 TaxID=3075199 RepID=UPI00288AD91E|nr:hypothetical protein [Streptomyces sp. ITFR-21]WNI17605.1 hypothetical protein RLT57_20160 [Streptomyces sp. ITFR-21]WNI17745.1 hypothetical protein RLT57_20875 [Streptomyces sp. ITFR-21]
MHPSFCDGGENGPELPVSVEDILGRAPERARLAYTSLVTNADSRYDAETGWSCAYITQQALADEMYVCLRTATRAVRDLRDIGLVRVLSWPGARTETQVRIASVDISSPFGPVQAALAGSSKQQLIDKAISQLVATNRELEALASSV